MAYCDTCKEWESTTYNHEGKWLCKPCYGKVHVSKGKHIEDATGKIRDRNWLRDKLEMTSSDRKWEADIRSRRITPDGRVVRVKR